MKTDYLQGITIHEVESIEILENNKSQKNESCNEFDTRKIYITTEHGRFEIVLFGDKDITVTTKNGRKYT